MEMPEQKEYPVRVAAKRPHGNTKTGLPFHKMRIGEAFEIPADDYNRTNSARAHYQKKNSLKKFSSSSVRGPDGRITGYIFRRDL